MILIVCQDCGTAVRVSGEHHEVNQLLGELNQDWYPDRYPCPSSTCMGKATFVGAVEPDALRVLSVYEVTPYEAFAAFNGLGLPEERDCGPTAVREALLKHKVVDLSVALIRGSNRSVLYSLTLESGVVVYLGSSPFGATVYRMAGRQSALQRLDDG